MIKMAENTLEQKLDVSSGFTICKRRQVSFVSTASLV